MKPTWKNKNENEDSWDNECETCKLSVKNQRIFVNFSWIVVENMKKNIIYFSADTIIVMSSKKSNTLCETFCILWLFPLKYGEFSALWSIYWKARKKCWTSTNSPMWTRTSLLKFANSYFFHIVTTPGLIYSSHSNSTPVQSCTVPNVTRRTARSKRLYLPTTRGL